MSLASSGSQIAAGMSAAASVAFRRKFARKPRTRFGW